MHPLVGMSLHQFHLLQDCDQEDLSLLSALVQPVAFRPGISWPGKVTPPAPSCWSERDGPRSRQAAGSSPVASPG